MLLCSGCCLAATTLFAQAPWFDFSRCPMPKAMKADDEAEKIMMSKDWPTALQRSFKLFGVCDDGSIAEGYSDAIVQSLAKRWSGFPRLAELMRKDKSFNSFVLAHIDATTSGDDLKALITNATTKCPKLLQESCHSVAEAGRMALEEH